MGRLGRTQPEKLACQRKKRCAPRGRQPPSLSLSLTPRPSTHTPAWPPSDARPSPAAAVPPPTKVRRTVSAPQDGGCDHAGDDSGDDDGGGTPPRPRPAGSLPCASTPAPSPSADATPAGLVAALALTDRDQATAPTTAARAAAGPPSPDEVAVLLGAPWRPPRPLPPAPPARPGDSQDGAVRSLDLDTICF